MSKAILISIQPKWCEKIAAGEKTVEVRKTRPVLDVPFKAYIYRTKGFVRHLCGGEWFNMPVGGHVIGEFLCDKIAMSTPGYKDHEAAYWELLDGSCLTADELMNYGRWKFLYGWHISDLLLYDEPKDLSEFTGLRKTKFGYGPVLTTRPPQSWCYVRNWREVLTCD